MGVPDLQAEDAADETLARLDWPRARLKLHRQEGLRLLLAWVARRSPWHARRLRRAGIDPAQATTEDLRSLEPMDKSDLAGYFDEIVTDRRLTRKACLRFLEEEDCGASAFVFGKYRVGTSGGSGGEPVLLVHSRIEMALAERAFFRVIERWNRRAGAWNERPVIAAVAPQAGRFRSYQVYRRFPSRETHVFSLLTPLPILTGRLNRVQPDILFTYPSLLPRFLEAVSRGRLRIRPKLVVCGGEPLLPEHEEAALSVWRCAVIDGFGSTEVGAVGCGSGFEPGLLLFDDIAIIEPVDRDGAPVGPGRLAEQIYITPLYHQTLPLLRYALTDQITLLGRPAACGSELRRATGVEGCLGDNFSYPGGVQVSSRLFRGFFRVRPEIIEYQVSQTAGGARAKLAARGPVDEAEVSRGLAGILSRCGLRNPEVAVERVDSIERTPRALKLKRFLPLPNPGGQTSLAPRAGTRAG